MGPLATQKRFWKMRTQVERARAYLSKLPPAIGGQRGHAATFVAACRLVEFGLTWEQALPLLAEWNATHCEPQWSERELEHKLQDAFQRTQPQPQFACNITKSGDARSPSKMVMTPVAGKSVAIPRRERQSVTLRPLSKIVAMGTGNPSMHTILAALRGVSIAAVSIAVERGLVRFGRWRGCQAWFVLDASQKIAQARRMDGCAWSSHGQGSQRPASHARFKVKALNLPGSQARWPVGIMEARDFPCLALCEGGPDLLAAFHLVIEHRRLTDCAPVAMLGASVPIHRDALRFFAGKRVRIFAHADEAGTNAVNRWACQLASVSADVDAFSFHGLTQRNGQPVKDLNNLVNVAVATSPCLNELFP